MKNLDSENIVRLLSGCRNKKKDKLYYLFMQFCNGGNLHEFVRDRGGFLDEATAKPILQ